MLRVISELRPTWVVGENVAGIVNMALDQVYTDLENEGYTVQALIIPACAVDAPHRRDRCAIIANYNEVRCDLWGSEGKRVYGNTPRHEIDSSSEDVAHAESSELQGQRRTARERRPEFGCSSWWLAEPNVGRVAHGLPSRVDRLKCLGNAVVPQQFYPIFQAITDIERGVVHG